MDTSWSESRKGCRPLRLAAQARAGLMAARRVLPVRGWIAGPLFLGLPLLSWAQAPRPDRSTIRLDQVVATLSDAELPLEGADVRLLARNVAATPEPRLEVRAIEPWGDRGARVRIRCETPAECLPFYVAVEWTNKTVAEAALRTPLAVAVSGAKPVRGPVYGASPVPPAAPDGQLDRNEHKPAGSEALAVESRQRQGTAETQVLAGSRATLLIEAKRLHIKVPVVCLEKGVAGQTIRVSSLDRKQTYRAEVVDSTQLKGTL